MVAKTKNKKIEKLRSPHCGQPPSENQNFFRPSLLNNSGFGQPPPPTPAERGSHYGHPAHIDMNFISREVPE